MSQLQNDDRRKEWQHQMEVEGISVQFKLDPGAEVNVLTEKVFDNMAKQKMVLKKVPRKTGTVLDAYGDFKLKPTGIIKLHFKHNNEFVMLEFMIVVGKRSLIGIKNCEKLGLVKRVHSVKKQDVEIFVKNNKIVFEVNGKFKEKCHTKI